MYGLPISNIEFIPSQNLILSMDSKIIKLWDNSSGKPYTSIEPPDTSLNDISLIKDTGLFFVANEDQKILTYYIPVSILPRYSSTHLEVLKSVDVSEHRTRAEVVLISR